MAQAANTYDLLLDLLVEAIVRDLEKQASEQAHVLEKLSSEASQSQHVAAADREGGA
jgi:hypothetical protein